MLGATVAYEAKVDVRRHKDSIVIVSGGTEKASDLENFRCQFWEELHIRKTDFGFNGGILPKLVL